MPACRGTYAIALLLAMRLRQTHSFLFSCSRLCGSQSSCCSLSRALSTAQPEASSTARWRGHKETEPNRCQLATARAAMEDAGAGARGRESASDDIREQFQALHAAMPSEGKEDMLQQASRDAHNRRQAAVFNEKATFFASPGAIPEEQYPSLRRIAEACRPRGEDEEAARVVDVGCGTGGLVPFLKEARVAEADIVGIDMASEMASVFAERYPMASVVVSDFVDFADESLRIREGTRRRRAASAGGGDGAMGSDTEERQGAEQQRRREEARSGVATVVFNAVFGNLWNQGAALERAAAILEEGGKVVISHPLGSGFVRRLKAVDSTVVPHELPDQDELERLVQLLPFRVESFESDRDIYLAVLRKTPYRASEAVCYLRGEVSTGYGRGSKKLGVPTANLPESQFAENLRSLPTGVYFGWAAIEDYSGDESAALSDPWKCVVNVGYSPTFAGEENAEKIVESYLIGYKGDDFYGKTMRLLLAGFQRPEKKFDSFPELVAAINKDVDDAAAALDESRFRTLKTDPFLFLAGTTEGSEKLEAWATKPFDRAVEDARPR